MALGFTYGAVPGAMDGPSTIRLQRKRGELPPDRLLVKRKRNGGDDDAGNQAEIAYERKKSRYISNGATDEAEFANSSSSAPRLSSPSTPTEPRTFHLSQPKKRKQDDASIATVIESENRPTKVKRTNDNQGNRQPQPEQAPIQPSNERTYKRPGRGAQVKPQNAQPDADQQDTVKSIASQRTNARKQMNDLAAEMHKFALEEMAKTEKPKSVVKPKLSASRARALHQQRSAASPQQQVEQGDVEMDDSSDSEYVYETYVRAGPKTLASTNGYGDNHATADVLRVQNPSGNIGYLVITEEDEELWENYMESQDHQDSDATDDEDENAEDYYAADYPSDELASDDEYDRGAYGYRGQGGSDDEQYDQQTWSDEEDERMRNPFGRKAEIPKAFRKYLDADRQRRGRGIGHESDEDDV